MTDDARARARAHSFFPPSLRSFVRSFFPRENFKTVRENSPVVPRKLSEKTFREERDGRMHACMDMHAWNDSSRRRDAMDGADGDDDDDGTAATDIPRCRRRHSRVMDVARDGTTTSEPSWRVVSTTTTTTTADDDAIQKRFVNDYDCVGFRAALMGMDTGGETATEDFVVEVGRRRRAGVVVRGSSAALDDDVADASRLNDYVKEEEDRAVCIVPETDPGAMMIGSGAEPAVRGAEHDRDVVVVVAGTSRDVETVTTTSGMKRRVVVEGQRGGGVLPPPVSPGVSAGAVGFVDDANPFAHTPAFPKTQRATPETVVPRGGRKFGFVYLNSGGRSGGRNEGGDTPNSNANVNVNVEGERHHQQQQQHAAAAAVAVSPFVLMQRHLADGAARSPYANLEGSKTPSALTLTTANGKSVVARAVDVPHTDGTEDGFTFRAAVETPATTSAPGATAAGLFTTGAGAPVVVSEDAMRRARSMFGGEGTPGIDRDVEDGVMKGAPTPKSLFQTGGGANIQVSDEAMRRARALFDEPPKSSKSSPTPGGTFAFQTAAGKTLEISDDATRRARALFSGMDENDASAVNTPIQRMRHASPFPQSSYKTPASLPAMRRVMKTPTPPPGGGGAGGFTPPMKRGGFTPPRAGAGASKLAPASAQALKRRRAPAVAVHDLFAARERMGARAPLRTFFNGLLPHQASPVFVDACVRTLNADNAKSLRLPSVDRGLVGWREIRQSMIKSGADDALLTNEWTANAYKWIVWTHGCIARAFPEKHAFGILSESAVTRRMLYRYEREINRAERPHARNILERDENPGAPAVFVVSAIRSMTSASAFGVAASVPTTCEIEITDGWYGLRASLDASLTRRVREGKIRVGCKLFCVGAELRGVQEAVSPFSEEAENAVLCLRVNGTRLAPWDAKLGRVRRTLTVPLRCVEPDGGIVPRLLVHVRRVYPIAYQERNEDDSTTRRSERAEARAHEAWCRAREDAARDFSENQPEGVVTWGGHGDVERHLREALEAKGLHERRVSKVFKLNIVGFVPSASHPEYKGPYARGATSAVLTVFGADDALIEAVKPGQTYAVTALRPWTNSATPEREIWLTATKYTSWTPISPADSRASGLELSEPMWRCASVDASVDLRDLSRTGFPRKEFDAVVCAVHRGPMTTTNGPRRSQWIFCVDVAACGTRDGRTHLLAVEVAGGESLEDAEHWVPGGAADGFGATNASCGPPMFLQNLEFARYDAENDVYCATVNVEDVVAVALSSGDRRPHGDDRILAAARRLHDWSVSSDPSCLESIAAIKRRAQSLTGSDARVGVGVGAGAIASHQIPPPVDLQRQIEYEPPRLSLDADDWNDETVAHLTENITRRLTRSASKPSPSQSSAQKRTKAS